MIKLRTARLSDLEQIMKIESESFISEIQENREVFFKRIEKCPETFLVFYEDNKKNENLCGYISAEYMAKVPSDASELKLNHLPETTDIKNILYISSFSLLPEYRGKGNGTNLWTNSISYFSKLSAVKKILLLVNEEWKGAFHIYSKSGFETINTFSGFFPSEKTDKFSDGILMELNIQ